MLTVSLAPFPSGLFQTSLRTSTPGAALFQVFVVGVGVCAESPRVTVGRTSQPTRKGRRHKQQNRQSRQKLFVICIYLPSYVNRAHSSSFSFTLEKKGKFYPHTSSSPT